MFFSAFVINYITTSFLIYLSTTPSCPPAPATFQVTGFIFSLSANRSIIKAIYGFFKNFPASARFSHRIWINLSCLGNIRGNCEKKSCNRKRDYRFHHWFFLADIFQIYSNPIAIMPEFHQHRCGFRSRPCGSPEFAELAVPGRPLFRHIATNDAVVSDPLVQKIRQVNGTHGDLSPRRCDRGRLAILANTTAR